MSEAGADGRRLLEHLAAGCPDLLDQHDIKRLRSWRAVS
jgi:hypothetical protein